MSRLRTHNRRRGRIERRVVAVAVARRRAHRPWREVGRAFRRFAEVAVPKLTAALESMGEALQAYAARRRARLEAAR